MIPSDILSSSAIRKRCRYIYDLAVDNKLLNFSVSPQGIQRSVDEVESLIRKRFPDLKVPLTSRWLHLSNNRREQLDQLLNGRTKLEAIRSKIDFIVLSVLTDAGAGAGWSYTDGNQNSYSRSEGLAQAGFDGFIKGAFSSLSNQPLRVDAAALTSLSLEKLMQVFQVTPKNNLAGLEGRVALLNRLGKSLITQSAAKDPTHLRPCLLLDLIEERLLQNTIQAGDLLHCVLQMFGPIWPGRVVCQGVNLGDTWVYPPFISDSFGGLIPFHKLSQWLTYSLIEPLVEYGIEVTQLDQLTALAEYRNGGLLLDCGAIVPHNPSALSKSYNIDDPFVVEWRALTVSIIDLLADKLRTALKLSNHELPLASVIEGGTWAAGREVAARLRSGGTPPISINSDGTVF